MVVLLNVLFNSGLQYLECLLLAYEISTTIQQFWHSLAVVITWYWNTDFLVTTVSSITTVKEINLQTSCISLDEIYFKQCTGETRKI